MDNAVVLLWLEGPLQSWGVDSLFSRRASLNFPTRSGVLGLICAALGAKGEQTELLACFQPFRQTVLAYARSGKSVERPLQLRDFHMVGNGYDDKDDWETLHIPKTSEGKKAVGGGAKLTYRYFVQDMAFAVALGVPVHLAEHLEQALQFPCWDISLGRRCCVPVEFVYQGLFAAEEQALEKAAGLAGSKNRQEVFRVCEGSHVGEERILADVPLRFGPQKLYAKRMVTIIAAG
ncbi:MAG: type I-E CRISPR-associated protein Cas5/CasD [Desulfovibrio sp.]|jgi:CRISPR system Cascade subunit CasD|nr:type I-E CRISPR-associated protein Cas5/CasD [Desulfovibrio sp.]